VCHLNVINSLILYPKVTKLVSLVSGGRVVASLAKESASSLPMISLCPGTQLRDTLAPLRLTSSIAKLARIWYDWPGRSDSVLRRYNPAWLSE
jgi:hypothetical protein